MLGEKTQLHFFQVSFELHNVEIWLHEFKFRKQHFGDGNGDRR